MLECIFTFFFYNLARPGTKELTVERGLRVDSNDLQRYERYFMAFWFELPNAFYTQDVMERLQPLECGHTAGLSIGGNSWDISINLHEVIFSSLDFDAWNDGQSNIFPYKEFKSVLLAWHKFLSIPVEPAGCEYTFKLLKESSAFSSVEDIEIIKTY